MRRRRRVPVTVFDPAAQRWVAATRTDSDQAPTRGPRRDAVTLATYNIWFDDIHAAQRYRAIADVLEPALPDVMVFQEVTRRALEVFGAVPWIRAHYRSAAVVGGDVGNYGMLVLTRVPVGDVTYVPLPTHLSRGILVADMQIDGAPLTVCSAHLDSGKHRDGVRARQLRRIYRILRNAPDAVLLGDFNMRDTENRRIVAPFRDVWPALRPGDPGYTEDTTINHMRYDMKDKHRHVRFDRVLVKGSAWSPSSIELLGTRPVSPDLPRIFPSDHFGVLCRLDLGGAGRGRTRRRWWARLG